MLERRFVMHLFWVENVFNMAKFCEICRDDLTILALKGRKPEICWTIALRPCKIICIFTNVQVLKSVRDRIHGEKKVWTKDLCEIYDKLSALFWRRLCVFWRTAYICGNCYKKFVYIVDTSRKLLRDLDEDYVDNCKKRKKNLLRDVDNFSTLSNY